MTTKPTAPKPPDPMTPAQALALAILALEWEAETAAAARNTGWGREVKAAAAVIRGMAGPPPEVCRAGLTGGRHPLSG